MVAGANAAPWPKLREELRLYPGPAGLAGEPSWTLHDPVAQRFFRLGWLEVEILNRWRIGNPEAIARSIAMETTMMPHPAKVEAAKNFFVGNNLVVADTPEDVERLVKQRYGKKKSLVLAAFKNYLFIRIPLVKPDGFLSRTLDRVEWLFSRWVAVVLGILALLGFYMISRQWAGFKDSFSALLTFKGGIMALAAIGFSKAVHELGHAYATKSLGLRVPSMGFSLMCFAPVLWTDTTEAWKLPRRKDRLFIGVSGVYSELVLAVVAALAWPLLPVGALKTVAFITASSTWILTLAVNINPCMRYDGYYLLSDYWNIAGLQTRSFALAKWWLREKLFGLGQPPPEIFEHWDRFKLIVYAFCTWVYRFFLFLGIALMVYHLFFKALGAVLMVVELVFFIALPVVMEIRSWIKLRSHFTFNFKLVRSCLLFAAIVFAFAYPWHARVEGAGLLFSERQALFFAQMGALVDDVRVKNGATVVEGDILFKLHSPDLDSRIEQASQKVALQRYKLSFASLDASLRAEMASDWEELERLAEDLGGMLSRRADLVIAAPFAGTVHDIPAWLKEDSWVGSSEGLGLMTGGGSLVAAFVSESDWSRIKVGNRGKFYPSGRGWEPLDMEIVMVDNQAVTEVRYPELASTLGGPLGVYKDAEGRLVPEHAVYRVLCKIEDRSFSGQFVVGQVNLEASPRSLLSIIWKNFVGLLIRESSWQ